MRFSAYNELEKFQHGVYNWAYLCIDDNMGMVKQPKRRQSRANSF